MKKILPMTTILFLYTIIVPLIGALLTNNNYVIIGLTLLPLIYCIYLKVKSKELPADSFYSPFGFIELHISRHAKKNKFKFYRYCYKTIRIAKKEKQDILFYTWHVSSDKLKEIFGEAITICKPSLLERIALISCLMLGVLPVVL